MIEITHLNGSSAVVNIDQIERIERTPDTLIVLSNGKTLMVQETPEQLVERASAYKRSLLDVEGPSR